MAENSYSASFFSLGSLNTYVGGLVGEASFPPTFTGCFWDTDVSKIVEGVGVVPDPSGIVGLPTSLMRQPGTFSDVGWLASPVFDASAWQMPQKL